MVHIFKILFITYLLCISCTPVIIDEPDRFTPIGTLNIRSGPGIDHNIVSTITKSDELFLLDAKNDWYRVKVPDGESGWVYRGFMKKVQYDKVVIIRRTYLYRGPGQNYETFAILIKGKTFPTRQQKGNWYLIDLADGNTGWVSKADAKKTTNLNLTTKSKASLRDEPTHDSREIIQVAAGTEIIQLDKKGNWYYVSVSGDVTGWIHANALRVVAEWNLYVPNKANIRRGASIRYDIIETLGPNSKLTELELKNGWYKVRTTLGSIGWAKNTVVKRISGASSSRYSPASSSDKNISYITTKSSSTTTTNRGGSTSSEAYAIPPEYILTNQECNIRQGYGINFERLTRVKQNTVLLKIGKKDNWYRIKYPPNGNVGWVRNDLVNNYQNFIITNQECNIRQSYSTSSNVKRRVPAGTPLAKIESNNDWERVYMPDGEIGWIRNDLIIDINNAFVVNQPCNIRQGPGLNSSKLGRLKVGDIVRRMSTEGDWYQIKLSNQKTAWVRNDLVVRVHDQFITKDASNLRAKPNTGSNLIKKLPAASRLYAINAQNNWLNVRVLSGGNGWIRQDLIIPTYHSGVSAENYDNDGSISTSPPSSAGAITSSPKTNVRMGPGFEYGILVRIAQGTELKKLEKEGEWYKVKLPDGTTGYIHVSVIGDIFSEVLKENNKFYTINECKLYKQPSDVSEVLKTLPANYKVMKMSQRGSWTYIKLDKSYLKSKAQLTSNVTSKDIIVEYGRLEIKKDTNIKFRPGMLEKVVTNVSKNDRLTKYGRVNDWLKVKTSNGTTGWLMLADVYDKTFKPIITIKESAIKLTPESGGQNIASNIKIGTVFYPRNEVIEWYAVRSASGKTGWIDKKDVTALKFSRIFTKQTNAKVRQMPDINASIITTFEEGAEFIPEAEENDWYLIPLPDGNKGWISKTVIMEQQFPRVRITKTTHAYKKPFMSSEEYALLRKDDVFIPAAIKGEWYKIFLRGGDFGWVYSSFVEEVKSSVLLLKSDSFIRKGAGVNYKILAVAPQGAKLKSYGTENLWCQVVAPTGKLGWILTGLTKDISYSEVVVIRRTLVRTGPAEKFAQLKVYDVNKKLTPIREKDGWYEFKVSDMQKGWILKKDCEKKIKMRTVFTLDLCNIRSGPGINNEVITKVDPATDLLVIGETGQWYKVKLTAGDGSLGWIMKELVFE